MMFARLSLLALCAVAAIATGASAGSFSPKTMTCIAWLANGFKDVTVPQEVNVLSAALEADAPYDNSDGDAWDYLKADVLEKHTASYPADICKKFNEEVVKIFDASIEAEACTSWGLTSNYMTKAADEDAVISPIMKANKACEAFMPYKDDVEDDD